MTAHARQHSARLAPCLAPKRRHSRTFVDQIDVAVCLGVFSGDNPVFGSCFLVPSVYGKQGTQSTGASISALPLMLAQAP